jgi:protein ImuB
VSVPRIVTVWCPHWSVTAAGAPPGTPAAVLDANRVLSASPAAHAAGVRTGQRRRDAQRCCPELVLVDHDPARDAREFEPVIRAIADVVPRLDVIEPGWVTFASRGPSRYFGGDGPLAERLAALVTAHTGTPVGVGVADGRFASTVAARRAVGATPTVVPVGDSSRFVAPLPVAWLREAGEAPTDLVDLLVRLGVRTLGDLADLPAGDVLGRFGPAGLHAHRLAGGADERPPDVVDPPVQRGVERVLDEPVEHLGTVVFVAKQLADDLAATLAAEGRVCTRLMVVLETDHGERSERSWYRDAGLSAVAMVERVRWQLDGWVTQPGGISAGISLVRLTPDEIRAHDGIQAGLWGGRSQADHDAVRAVTRLVGMAGDDAVRVPVWQGGRLPTDRYRWVPATTVDLDDPQRRLEPSAEPWPGATPSPSAAVVHPEPVPIEVVDACGAAVRVTGRGDVSAPPVEMRFDGSDHPVVAWAGPWPVDQRWWDTQRHRRVARFQMVTAEGAAYLVFVERRQWWLAAEYA